jgi:hypothetical protein
MKKGHGSSSAGRKASMAVAKSGNQPKLVKQESFSNSAGDDKIRFRCSIRNIEASNLVNPIGNAAKKKKYA